MSHSTINIVQRSHAFERIIEEKQLREQRKKIYTVNTSIAMFIIMYRYTTGTIPSSLKSSIGF